MTLLRKRATFAVDVGLSLKEEMEEQRFRKLYTVIQLHAKSQWYDGLFVAAKGCAVEASDLAL